MLVKMLLDRSEGVDHKLLGPPGSHRSEHSKKKILMITVDYYRIPYLLCSWSLFCLPVFR